MSEEQKRTWHKYDPMVGDKKLKDHHFYLVRVKNKGTPMKAKYHCDAPFGFCPATNDFDPLDVTGWIDIPEVESDV